MTATDTTETHTIDLRDRNDGDPEPLSSDRHQRRRQRYGTGTVIDAMTAMVFGLLFAGVLNIHQLVDEVESREDLPAREQVLSVLEPVEGFIETALLDQPRELLDRLADD